MTVNSRQNVGSVMHGQSIQSKLRSFLQKKRDKIIRAKYRETRSKILKEIRERNLNRFK